VLGPDTPRKPICALAVIKRLLPPSHATAHADEHLSAIRVVNLFARMVAADANPGNSTAVR
jgi:hypothetical protein